MARPKIVYDFEAHTVKMVSELQKGRQALQGMSADLKLIKFDSIVNLGQKAFYTAQQIYSFLEIGAKVQSVTDAFNLMAKNSGIAVDSLISDLKKATVETIDDSDLMVKATRLISEGFSPEQIIVVAEAARTASRLMGTTVTAAYEQIADAIVNLRTRGLKTAGFIIDMDEAYANHAKTLGVNAEALNDYGKQMAIVNAVKEKNLELTDKLSIANGTEYEQLQKITAQMKEFKETMAGWALVAWQELQSYIASTYTGIKNIVKLLDSIKGKTPYPEEEEHGGAARRAGFVETSAKDQIKKIKEKYAWEETRPHGTEWVTEVVPIKLADGTYLFTTVEEIQKNIDQVEKEMGRISEERFIPIELAESSAKWREQQAGITDEVRETAKAYDITAEELLRIRAALEGGVKDNQHFIDSLKEIPTVFEEIGRLLSSNMTILMSGTEKWMDKFKKMGESILQTLAQIALKMALIEAFKGIQGENKESGWGRLIGSIIKGIGSFQSGTNYVPQTGLYQLHQGEAVVPREENRGGDTYITYMNVEATDVDSFEKKYGGSVNKIWRQSARKGGIARKAMRSYI